MEAAHSISDLESFHKLEVAENAWNNYINHHSIPTNLSPMIAASWQRCRLRLNPFQKILINQLSADHLLATQVASFELISFARPVMEDIYQYIENSNSAVVLVNGAGYLLNVLGDPEMLRLLRQLGISTGSLVAESHFGTNAFSLAVTERLPFSIRGAEHFLQKLHDLSEVAAPIFDLSGRPLGALGVMNLVNQQHPHSLGLVVAGARAIEAQRQADYLLAETNNQLAGLNAILSAINDGILVWNAEGILLHINTAAAKMLDTPSRSLVGHSVSETIHFPLFIQEALQRREALTDVEANIGVNHHSISCVISLRFVFQNNDLQSTILTLRQEKDVRQLVQRQFGTQALSTFDDIAAESMEMRHVMRIARTASEASASVLLRGESGTGKNILASAIHNASQRAEGPFLIFACSTVPNEMIVNELLGYEEGTIRRRSGGRPSKFELAQGGTIFFQDVDALPLEAQAILLNVLDLGIVQRLSSDRPIEVDLRVLAATTANMEKLISQGNFRADLFYRLSSFEIMLPPLRERQKDLPILVERILKRLSRQFNRALNLADGVIDLLRRYSWPGNIRELESVLGRAATQAGVSEVIGPMHLPEFIRRPVKIDIETSATGQVNSLDDLERQAILQAARVCNGNVTKMAQALSIGRTTLWRKMKTYGISPEDFRLIH
jgi:transcriptional regulator of acetoin/glycerol metabolism